MASRFARLQQASFTRGLAILISASLLQTLITLGSAPVISRLFSPQQFGIAGLTQAVSVVPILFATGQYYSAIGIARSRAEAFNVICISLALVLLGTMLSLPLVLVLQRNPQILPAGLIPITTYLWTIPPFILATNLVFISRLWEIRHARYRTLVANRVLESGGIAAAQIGFGLLGACALGLIIGRWLGTVAAGLHGLSQIIAQICQEGHTISLRQMWSLARRHWRFPAYELPAAVLNGLTLQLMPLLLGLFYTIRAVGYFWFAARLLERPAIILGDNVGRVFYQHAADRRAAGQPVFGLYWRSTCGLAVVGIVPFGLIILFGPTIFDWVFGSGWDTAGHYARWIALANYAFLIGFPARLSPALFNMQSVFAAVELTRALVSALAVMLIASTGGDAIVAVAVAASAQSFISLCYVTFIGLRLWHLDRSSVSVLDTP